jgi:hypothetical protein
MRRVVTYENALLLDHWFMLPGTFRVQGDQPLYLFYNFDYREILGEASKMEREEFEGVTQVTFDIDIRPEWLLQLDEDDLDSMFEFSVFANHLKAETYDSVQEIYEATIRAISIVPIAANPLRL